MWEQGSLYASIKKSPSHYRPNNWMLMPVVHNLQIKYNMYFPSQQFIYAQYYGERNVWLKQAFSVLIDVAIPWCKEYMYNALHIFRVIMRSSLLRRGNCLHALVHVYSGFGRLDSVASGCTHNIYGRFTWLGSIILVYLVAFAKSFTRCS